MAIKDHDLWKPLLALVIGVFAISTGAIFARFAQEDGASSLIVATGRLSIAALLLSPIVFKQYRHELKQLRFFDLVLTFASGFFLSIHFVAWLSSLEYTSVVNSTVLVTTSPLWVAILSPFLLRDRLSRWVILGLVLAFSGGFLVSVTGKAGDPPTRPDALLGNSLAVLGAVMIAFYLLIGRQLRVRLSVIPYVWLVYSATALILLVTSIISGETAQISHLPTSVFLWLLLMAIIPQLVGHSAFNYALGFLPATYVSMMTLGEPIGSGILAIILLGEWPTVLQVVGAALILTGIAVATRDQMASSTTPSAE